MVANVERRGHHNDSSRSTTIPKLEVDRQLEIHTNIGKSLVVQAFYIVEAPSQDHVVAAHIGSGSGLNESCTGHWQSLLFRVTSFILQPPLDSLLYSRHNERQKILQPWYFPYMSSMSNGILLGRQCGWSVSGHPANKITLTLQWTHSDRRLNGLCTTALTRCTTTAWRPATRPPTYTQHITNDRPIDATDDKSLNHPVLFLAPFISKSNIDTAVHSLSPCCLISEAKPNLSTTIHTFDVYQKFSPWRSLENTQV